MVAHHANLLPRISSFASLRASVHGQRKCGAAKDGLAFDAGDVRNVYNYPTFDSHTIRCVFAFRLRSHACPVCTRLSTALPDPAIIMGCGELAQLVRAEES